MSSKPTEIEVAHATTRGMQTRDSWSDHEGAMFATREELNDRGDVRWTITHINTGFKFPGLDYSSRKRALAGIRRLEAIADWSVLRTNPGNYRIVLGMTDEMKRAAIHFRETEAS